MSRLKGRLNQIVLVLVSLTVLTTRIHAAVKDKSALYARYPQLISQETDPCIRGLNQMLINLKTEQT